MSSAALLLKLTLSPTLVAGASLAARRWGPQVGGWIAGFPIVAGPVLFFYAWEQGVAFASQAAVGTLVGLVSLALFAVVYGRTAFRFPWWASLLTGWGAFALATFALQGVKLPWYAALPLGAGALGLGLVALPKSDATVRAVQPPAWDLPLRIVATAAIVVTLTALADVLGPRLSGLLTPFPVATSVLVAFFHREQGGAGAVRILRGLLTALFGFAGFCAVLSLTVVPWGLAGGFGAALVTASVVQLATLRVTLGR